MPDLVTIAANVWPNILAAGGGGAAAAYLMLKTMGGKWLENHFAARLETVKHLQAQEMAHLKLSIDGKMDRAAKRNAIEFEALPTIWSATTQAHATLLTLVTDWHKIENIREMKDPEFESFLENCGLEEWQKNEMRSKERWECTTYYFECVKSLRLNATRSAMQSWKIASLQADIFINPDLFNRLEEFGNKMINTFNYYDMVRRHRPKDMPPAPDCPVEFYKLNGKTLYDELAKYIRERLWAL